MPKWMCVYKLHNVRAFVGKVFLLSGLILLWSFDSFRVTCKGRGPSEASVYLLDPCDQQVATNEGVRALTT